MQKRTYYRQWNDGIPGWDTPRKAHFFKKLFGRKSATAVQLRPGAMPPEEVKRKIQQAGVGKVVEILRIGYDGTIDDIPIIVEILDITEEGFTGKIVNVERDLIEESTKTVVFAKRGGGTIEFRYDDGDINEIKEAEDTAIIEESQDIEALKEVLSALEKDDPILVAYYDKKRRGTVNVEGRLLATNADKTRFRMLVEKINRIELEEKREREFDIKEDMVIDIEIV
ncbi:MAG: hypothetical protein GXO78_05410 [Calditrichaeota bacterium]|nr:hypothetical protein [Calditrichota bacterium]